MRDNKTKDGFIELRAAGFSYIKIAKDLSVSKQTLINWSREFELEIANLRAMELDALKEKYGLLIQNRIERFGKQLQGLDKELAKRDFSEIPTEKLHDLIMKYGKFLKEEEIEMEFQQEKNLFELETSETVRWQG